MSFWLLFFLIVFSTIGVISTALWIAKVAQDAVLETHSQNKILAKRCEALQIAGRKVAEELAIAQERLRVLEGDSYRTQQEKIK